MLTWQDLHHSELTVPQLYALLHLRCAVFVVEQNCPYLDVDGEDLSGENRHILGWQGGKLVAYARILTSDRHHPLVIGRVIVDPACRGQKLGNQLLEHIMVSCQQHWPDVAPYLSAQAHLQHFYQQFGFEPITDVYLEDDIPHRGMVWIKNIQNDQG